MTREEEIVLASKQQKYSLFSNYGDAFITGAKWADENPNLSSLWHDGSEEPKENTDILFITEKGKVHKVSKVDDWFYDWINENDGIKRWVYLSDLLPKE